MLPPDPSDDLQSYFQVNDPAAEVTSNPLYIFDDPFLPLGMNMLDELTADSHVPTAPISGMSGKGYQLSSSTHSSDPNSEAFSRGKSSDSSSILYGDAPFLGIQPVTIQPSVLKASLKAADSAAAAATKDTNSSSPSTDFRHHNVPRQFVEGSFNKPKISLDSPTFSHGTPSSTMSIDLPRRDAHMASEQRRRAIMGQCFERLKQLLPPSEYRKPSKANILQAVVNYLETLQRQERILRNRLQIMQQENTMLSQQVHGGANPFATTHSNLGNRNPTLDAHQPIAPK